MLGTNIAHYKITAKLGQGGMGEVYRAMDTKLDREVAIKVLPESVVGDKERLARFEREAKVLAQLNHANIAGVHGLEQSGDSQALILELVDGEDLSKRLKKGPLPIDESLEVCKQIAEALEAAHEKGIIHRDLKPGNIKLSADGKVKVLDFGLAKALADESDVTSSTDQEDSPTITDAFTKPGTILGTAAYMSPEQARGKHVDKRTDIWAFGCVLFECLTGKRTFKGEDVAETLAKIIQGQPDWDQLPPALPPAIQLLLRKCLAKKRNQRLRDIGDAVVDMDQDAKGLSGSLLLSGNTSQYESTPRRAGSRFFLWSAMAMVLLVGVSLGWFGKTSSPEVSPRPYFSDIILPGKDIVTIAIAPDASNIGFDMWGRRDGMRLLRLDGSKEITHFDVEESWVMDYSPSGQEIVWVSKTQIWKANVDGSSIVSLVDFSDNPFPFSTFGVSWSEGDEIVFPAGHNAPLMKVSAEGGLPHPLTQLKANEKAHIWPQCLPGGRYVLFLANVVDENSVGLFKKQIAIADMTTGEHQVFPMNQDCVYPRYSKSGHLLFLENEVMFALPFDLGTRSITGKKVDVLHGIKDSSFSGLGLYDLSDDGTLVYRETTVRKEDANSRLKWIHFDGTIEEAGSIDRNINGMQVSPSGSRLIVTSNKGPGSDNHKDLWLYDLENLIPMRFSHSEGDDMSPVWSEDEEWIYFRSKRLDGQVSIRRKNTQSPESESEFVADYDAYPQRMAKGEKLLTAVVEMDPQNFDIVALDLTTRPATIKNLKETPANELWHDISPNGKWLAYASDVSGTLNVYIAPLETPDTNVRPVSVEGGNHLTWSGSGDRLFYEVQGIASDYIMVVEVEDEEEGLTIHPPKKFLDLPFGFGRWRLDTKHERILVTYKNDAEEQNESIVGPDHNVVSIVSNFFTVLKEKAPKK